MPDNTDSWAQTRDINLASALASFDDIELHDQLPVIKYKDHQNGEEFCVFRFKPSAHVDEVMRLWADADLLKKQPEHPVSYMRAFIHNRNRFLDAIKAGGVWNMVKKGGRIFFINKANE
jgi:hypothetical protein